MENTDFLLVYKLFAIHTVKKTTQMVQSVTNNNNVFKTCSTYFLIICTMYESLFLPLLKNKVFCEPKS